MEKNHFAIEDPFFLLEFTDLSSSHVISSERCHTDSARRRSRQHRLLQQCVEKAGSLKIESDCGGAKIHTITSVGGATEKHNNLEGWIYFFEFLQI